MKEYPIWQKGIAPDTDKNASITGWRKVKNIRVVHIKNGEYRNATLNGFFEVVNHSPSKGRIQVCCAWFGIKYKTTYPKVRISNATFKFYEDYTGPVADNISNPKKYNKINYPEEIDPQQYKEGAVKNISINAYERNAQARAKCISHHGAKCYSCEFDFEITYGTELGNGYIHVHHIKDISLCGGEYQVDPIEDLRPLCPNCHAMVHKQRNQPAMHPDDLREIIKHIREENSES